MRKEQEEREEDRQRDAEARKLAEAQKMAAERRRVEKKRAKQGRCILCGSELSKAAKLLGRAKHFTCSGFVMGKPSGFLKKAPQPSVRGETRASGIEDGARPEKIDWDRILAEKEARDRAVKKWWQFWG